jgi:methionyl-tRNA synthetase
VPRSGDADFREALLAARANELADDLGNLVNRTIALVRRSRPGDARLGERVPAEAAPLAAALERLGPAIDAALDRFDFRSAAAALWQVVAEANRFVAVTRPWEAASLERLDDVLAVLLTACRTVAVELEPFLPRAAGRIREALDLCDPERGRRLFVKVPT